MLSAGPIPHNSIHLLIITADFVALYRFYWICPFIITSFLAGVESTDQCLLNSKVLSCFSGVIMSIRSFFLLMINILSLSLGGLHIPFSYCVTCFCWRDIIVVPAIKVYRL